MCLMYEKYDIKEIRFLPMGENEFKSVEDAREFLKYILPKEQDGGDWYQTRVLIQRMKYWCCFASRVV